MIAEATTINWSTTGKRVDMQVDVYEGGLFGKGEKTFSFKMFALGNAEVLKRYKDNEEELADKIAAAREQWLNKEGRRYYRHALQGNDITVSIWKSKYQVHES